MGNCPAEVITGGVACKEHDEYILTHQLTPAGPVPTAYDPNGVYPYTSYAETFKRPESQARNTTGLGRKTEVTIWINGQVRIKLKANGHSCELRIDRIGPSHK